MVAIGSDVYIFGGQGRTMFEDLRFLDCSKKEEYNWVLLESGESQSKVSETKPGESGGAIADAPGPRTATVLSRYGAKLILFGGSGPYISHIHCRRAYYDILQYDTLERRWFEDKRPIRG